MRISIRKDDPGYHPMAYKCEAYLDGVKLRRCFTADEEKGEVYCYEEDENGKIFIDPEKPDCIKEIVLYGKVKVVVPFGFLDT